MGPRAHVDFGLASAARALTHAALAITPGVMMRCGVAMRLRGELEKVGVTETPRVTVADSGYWNEEQIDNVVSDGIQVLIPPDAGKRGTPRPGWDGGRYAFMRTVLAGDLGGGLYRKRKAMVEPVFAQTKHNRRINQFQRRGRSAAR